MLLLRETRHVYDPSTLEVFYWLFLLLLCSSILSPEQAIRDLFRQVIARSSFCQLVQKFLQIEAQKGVAALGHGPTRGRRHRFLQLQQFGEETVKQIVLPIQLSTKCERVVRMVGPHLGPAPALRGHGPAHHPTRSKAVYAI